MALNPRSARQQLWQALGSVRTGIILLILVGLAVMAGTLILQRPITEPAKLHEAYSPQVLRWLDMLRLTDVFHSWWFVLLLSVLSANIVVASLDRFPQAWRYFSRPARRAERHFFSSLALKEAIPIRGPLDMAKVELAFRRAGWKPQYVADNHGPVSLYAERFRLARLAPFVVHASLLMILSGGIVDAIWGYKGFISLGQNDSTNQLEMRDGTHMALPFAIRCDGAGQENYADGSPKRWWSRLAVLENGREVKRKEIAVNDPLTYRGLRFYQASYGPTGDVSGIKLLATSKKDAGSKQEIWVPLDKPAAVDPETSVRIAQFIPDFVVVDNHIESRSDQPNNPAVQLSIASKERPETTIWLFPKFPEFAHESNSAFDFRVKELKMGYFTGLEVSHEPGQWAVWAGVVLMGLALALTFYFVHVRLWALPVDDGAGHTVLWIGASASKNREDYERRFRKLVEVVQQSLETQTSAAGVASAELVLVK